LDRDYLIDQVFWRHAALLADRLDAQDFADELYSEPAQVLHLGEDRAGMLTPWLDELVTLSLDGPSPDRFYRLQALLFAVLDVITPYVRTTPVRRSSTQRKAPAALVHLLFISSRRCAPRHDRPSICFAMHPNNDGHSESWLPRCTCRRRSSAACSWMPMGRHR